MILNFKGKLIKRIDRLLDRNIKYKRARGGRGGVFGGVWSPYTPKLILTSLKNNKIIYAKSNDYRLFVLDKDGNLILEIKKKEKPIPVPKRVRKQKRIFIPEYCPFLSEILTDDKGRIWVIKFKSILEKSDEWEIDIFGSDGKYLYYTKIPYYPFIIKKSHVYSLIRSKETGKVIIKRLKLKNWDRIKYKS